MGNYVITIARGFGSGGSHIGKQLAKELNLKYYDEEILLMAAELSGINEKYFFESNERIKGGHISFHPSGGVYTGGVIHNANDRMFLSDENLFNYQAKVIKLLAVQGEASCVIIGKAANHLLQYFNNVIKINIQASKETCIENVMKRMKLDEEDAEALVEKTNRYRKNYYKYYIGRDWYNPKEYDLSINSGSLGEDYAVELIKKLVKDRGLLKGL